MEKILNKIADFKNVAYLDRVYSALSIIHSRNQYIGCNEVDLALQELRIFSQNGEDGVLHALISALNIKNKFFVEFGVGDGWSCNCRILAEIFGWSGVFFECDTENFAALNRRYVNSSKVNCYNSMIFPETVNNIFDKSGVPENIGVMVIDIDGQDYWVWEALENRFRPAIVIVEYNSSLGLEKMLVEEKGVAGIHLGRQWGASFKALVSLAEKKGYRLVHSEMTGVNLFFVRDDLLATAKFKINGNVEGRSPNWGLRGRALPDEQVYSGESRDERPVVNLLSV